MPDTRSLIRRTEHTALTVASTNQPPAFRVGVPGAVMSNAMPVTIDSHTVELVEFRGPDDRTALVHRPCDAGAARVSFATDDLDVMLSRVESAGRVRRGTPQRMSSGMVAAYVRGPAGHRIELMQPPAA